MGSNKIWIAAIALMAIMGAAAVTGGFGISGTQVTGASTAMRSSGTVKIPLSGISEEAKFYEYDADGATIRFFAVKADDGSIKTGFDACDVCYGSGKGYRQEGNYMVCNNCGNRYPISELGTANKNPGGCWPGFLPSTIQDSDLVIQKSDIEDGRWRFA